MGGLLTINTRTNGVSRDMEMACWRSIGAEWLLVHNDPELVWQANAAGAKVVYRQDPDKSLPEFANSAEMQRHAEAFTQTRMEKGAYAVHLTNEIGSFPGLQSWTRFCLEYAYRNGAKAVPFNFGTHAPRWQHEQSEANIRYCVEHDMPVGIHVYLDGLHDATAFEWLWLKQKYGGTWLITEFNYIVSYDRAEFGPLATQSDEVHSDWLLKNVERFVERVGQDGLAICYFSYETWPDNDQGAQTGFGLVNRMNSQKAIRQLNQRYVYRKGKPIMPDILPPTTGGLEIRITSFPNGVLYRNIRLQPVASAIDLGDLKVGDVVVAYPAAPQMGWVYIDRAADGTKGWALWDGVNYETTGTPVPPADETVTIKRKDYEAALTSLQVALEHNAAARVALEDAVAYLKGAMLPDTGGSF